MKLYRLLASWNTTDLVGKMNQASAEGYIFSSMSSNRHKSEVEYVVLMEKEANE